KQLRIAVPQGPLPVPLLIDLVQVAMSVLCDHAADHKLVIISKSGFHRAGTVAACILCAFGLSVERSIRIVRDARGTRSLGRESRDQLVAKFDVAFKKYLIEKVLHTGDLFHSPPTATANAAAAAAAAATTKPTTDQEGRRVPTADGVVVASGASFGAIETPGINRAQITVWPSAARTTH
ncbi:MAG: hypothetical protein P4M09_29005, partial [Devosia sp.]|nr:hypothetical protein [Devosia sp.]